MSFTRTNFLYLQNVPCSRPSNAQALNSSCLPCRRQALLYAGFAIAIVLFAVVLTGAYLIWPAPLKSGTLLLLILCTLYFITVVALTAGLKVGNDACANLEAQIEQRVADPTTRQVVQYYLYDTGPGVNSILNTVFKIDVDEVLNKVSSAREQLLNGVDTYTLGPLLQDDVDSAVVQSFLVSASIGTVMELLSYEAVHPGEKLKHNSGCLHEHPLFHDASSQKHSLLLRLFRSTCESESCCSFRIRSISGC